MSHIETAPAKPRKAAAAVALSGPEKPAEAVIVTALGGGVGKTRITVDMLYPRMSKPTIYSVETINESASDLGIPDAEKVRGGQFRQVLNAIIGRAPDESILVDVGASNVESFLNQMLLFKGALARVDRIILPVTAKGKEQGEAARLVAILRDLKIPAAKIWPVFNMIETVPDEDCPAFISFCREAGACNVAVEAMIPRNELFDIMSERRTTLGAILMDATDFLAEAAKPGIAAEERSRLIDCYTTRELALGVNEQLDRTFSVIFRGGAQ